MRIVVLSDTHLPKRGRWLPPQLIQDVERADVVLHAGDFMTGDVLDDLLALNKNLVGVVGNNDDAEIRQRLKRKEKIRLGGRTIGLVHGDGGVREQTAQRAWHAFRDEAVDVIVFGHSHLPFLKTVQKTILFNPGSATERRRSPYYSYGIMEITDGSIRLTHVFYGEEAFGL